MILLFAPLIFILVLLILQWIYPYHNNLTEEQLEELENEASKKNIPDLSKGDPKELP